MSIEAAIMAVAGSQAVGKIASDAWAADADKLIGIGVNTDRRRAMLIGQCAHESAKFLQRQENLNYSGDALWRVFRKYFASRAATDAYARQPEKIANRVYGSRMGNGPESSGDGWRYRGRGYLQLTGKDNYGIYGKALGIDLVADPDKAADPAIAWQIAARYCATRKRSGRNLLEWADVPDIMMVTKGINGGTHGLNDRQTLTDRAYAALCGEVSVAEQQRLLAHAGFDPGAIDGLMGRNTQNAIDAAKARFGVSPPDLWDKLRAVD